MVVFIEQFTFLIDSSANHLKNLVYSMSVVLSERMEHTQEYEALLTLFDTVRNHIEDVQGSSEKISELLEPCALEVSKTE
ncbi:hypothetical protein SAMN04515695_2553 [Pseudovibrio sp. Tun.PSC04-5.I4]|nr:hypothetical protein SAMN04515695_2553 [Pseudovibrio sp. Tun.PSC04-5.I4]